uniref:Uncharacterized protein n=1 Tax=Magnetococcus massalia (strain MO-1) TaxID=451514 RepID=A0A1S7LKP8_MAGMO|nr:Protein of unknown function [Candidatus Magnetococcus massalia]
MLEAVDREAHLRQVVADLKPLLKECLVLLLPVEILHVDNGEPPIQ